MSSRKTLRRSSIQIKTRASLHRTNSRSGMTRTELLRRYFVWCGERIDEQLAQDLRSIRWLGGGFVEFVVSWLQPMNLLERSQFFRSLLVRRWMGAYGDSVPAELLRSTRSTGGASRVRRGATCSGTVIIESTAGRGRPKRVKS